MAAMDMLNYPFLHRLRACGTNGCDFYMYIVSLDLLRQKISHRRLQEDMSDMRKFKKAP